MGHRSSFTRTCSKAFDRSLRSTRGFTLAETMVAMVVLSVLLLAVLAGVQTGVVGAVKSREQLRASRLAQIVYSRSLNMDFYNVFACNSSTANFGLWAGYPERASLQAMQDAVRAAGFSHFTIDVKFMRRNLSNSYPGKGIGDLVPFTDGNNDRIDDYDSGIRYNDQNNDGDYYDTFMSAGRKVAEQPDTHIKSLTITIWKGGTNVSTKQGQLLSAEQFTGIENPSSESALSLNLITPENNAYLYSELTSAQSTARALSITKSYPADVLTYRADGSNPISLTGNTEPSTDVRFSGSAGGATLDTVTSDFQGDFTLYSSFVTSWLTEGLNYLYAKAVKGALTSPYATKTYVYDIVPPSITNEFPAASGTAKTLSPYVGVTLLDLGVSTTAVSGICEDVTSFFNGSSTVPYRYDAVTGALVWKTTDTFLPPTLTDGQSYTVTVEGGDYAKYKAKKVWSFTVDIDDTDNSAPDVSNRTPLGNNAPAQPTISCRVQDNQSGVIPTSVVMTLDGVEVVGMTATPVLGDYYDASTGAVSYTPAAPLASGEHTVTIHAEHWAQDPPDPDKRLLDPAYDVNAQWTFNIP